MIVEDKKGTSDGATDCLVKAFQLGYVGNIEKPFVWIIRKNGQKTGFTIFGGAP